MDVTRDRTRTSETRYVVDVLERPDSDGLNTKGEQTDAERWRRSTGCGRKSKEAWEDVGGGKDGSFKTGHGLYLHPAVKSCKKFEKSISSF